MNGFTSPLTSVLSHVEDSPYSLLLKWLAVLCNTLLFKAFDLTTLLFSKLSGTSVSFWIRRYCEYFIFHLNEYDKATEQYETNEQD